jgi:hypothetical protein
VIANTIPNFMLEDALAGGDQIGTAEAQKAWRTKSNMRTVKNRETETMVCPIDTILTFTAMVSSRCLI